MGSERRDFPAPRIEGDLMLPSLLATVLCTALPSSTPLDVPALSADGTIAADVGVHVTPTQLVARNFSSVPQLLAFRDAGSGLRALITLHSGGRLEFSYPREALELVQLEVLCERSGSWSTSGALDLGGTLACGEETFWIQQLHHHSCTWLQVGTQLALVEAGPSLLPRALQREDEGAVDGFSASCAPTHVPVITPGEKPRGDLPPKLERRPLPPV
jgi:hypothetical protein